MMSIDLDRTKARFNKNNERRITNFGYAASPEGQDIIKRHIVPLVEFIAKVRKECPPPRKRPQRSLTQELWRAMDGVPNDVMAWAVFAGTLNAIWTREPDASAALKARLAIGWEIWRECRGVAIRKADKQLASEIAKAAVRKGSMQAREAQERRRLRTHGVDFPRWGPDLLVLAGNWGYDCLRQALPNIFPETSDGIPAIDADAVDDAEAFVREVLMFRSPVYSPSSEPPPPWTDFEDADGTCFVRKSRDEATIRDAMASGQMQPHVDAVNHLQATAWMINEPVLDFIKEVAKRRAGRKLLKKVKKKTGWAVFKLDMAMATSLVGHPFWIRHNIDFRGRCYPLPHFNYSRADHIRGLFKFARGEPIGRDGILWLKFAAAAAYNGSRVPYFRRFWWTDDNLGRIVAAAENPMGHREWIGQAADPIQFLAIAIELKNANNNPDFITTLPIGFDASCSGAQHYSLLARDPAGAKLTNLVPSTEDNVECLYESVRHHISRQIATAAVAGLEYDAMRWWREHIDQLDRPLFKGVLIPYFYGSEEGGLRLAIYDELFDREFRRN
jgi:hypothetical protein